MKTRIVSVTLATILAAPAYAGSVDLSLSNHSARAQVNAMDVNAPIAFGMGYTYHTGGRHIGNVDVHAQGRTAVANLPTTVGLGVRAIGFDDHGFTGGGLGVGGYAILNIPQVPGLSVEGSAHYAPNVLSFDDARNIFNLDAKVSYRIIRNGAVYGGYRYLNVDRDHRPSRTLDAGMVVGMKLFF